MVRFDPAGVRARLGNFPKSGGYGVPALAFLRRDRRLVWLVIGWFLLSIAAAVASGAIATASARIVCSTVHDHHMAGHGDDDAPATGHHHIGDCPLCVTAGVPPTIVFASLSCQPPAHAPTWWQVAHVTTLSAGPAPARGPPSI
jgi:hypothetical protein